MKFSDIDASTWNELQPYVDTCILPITGLTGEELPWEATRALESLRDALDCLEIPYKGRVLTYPAFHFLDGSEVEEQLARIYLRLKQNFRYVVLVSAKEEAISTLNSFNPDAVFILTPEMLANAKAASQQQVAEKLQQLWTAR